jgi:hypothetical protein
MMEDDVLRLYAFRFYDSISKRWVRARYVATMEEIQTRHQQFEIIGEPELRKRGDPFKGLHN